MSSLKLHPDQVELVTQAYKAIKRLRAPNRRLLIVAATGIGKTVIATYMIRDSIRRGRAMFIVDRDNLVDQTAKAIRKWLPGERIGFIKAGKPEDRAARLQIASRQTMESRGWWRPWISEGPCVIFIDEAHEVAFSSVVRKLLESPEMNQIFIGLTATPWRMSKREGMGDLFDDMVQAAPPKALMTDGRLLWPRYVCVRDFDEGQVRITSSGELHQGSLALVSDTPRVIASLFRNWDKYVQGERNAIFAVNKGHAKNIAAHWHEAGHAASVITEESTTGERWDAYRKLSNGQIPTLVNVNVATKGFDETKLRWVVLARKTKSIALLHQMIGRGARTDRPCLQCGEEVFLSGADNVLPVCRACGLIQPAAHMASWPTWFGVLDQTGTLLDPGMILPDQIERYELHRGTGGQPGRPPTRECPVCSNIVPLSAKVCEPARGGCGFVFPHREVMETVGDAVEVSVSDATFLAYSGQAKSSYSMGYDPDHAEHKWAARGRKRLPDAAARGAIFGLGATPEDRRRFRMHLERSAAKKVIKRQKEGKDFDPEAWIEGWMMREFGEAAA